MFLSPLGERLGEGVKHEGCLLHRPLTQPLPQGGEEHERRRRLDCYSTNLLKSAFFASTPTRSRT